MRLASLQTYHQLAWPLTRWTGLDRLLLLAYKIEIMVKAKVDGVWTVSWCLVLVKIMVYFAVRIMRVVCRIWVVILNFFAVSAVKSQRNATLWRRGKAVGIFTLWQGILSVRKNTVNFNSILYFKTILNQALNGEWFSLSDISIKFRVSTSLILVASDIFLCRYKPLPQLRSQRCRFDSRLPLNNSPPVGFTFGVGSITWWHKESFCVWFRFYMLT